MFVIHPEAKHRLSEARVQSDLFADSEAQGHDEHGREEQGHDEGDSRHADIEAEYRFACAEPKALQEVRIALFDAFPATQRMQVIFTDMVVVSGLVAIERTRNVLGDSGYRIQAQTIEPYEEPE